MNYFLFYIPGSMGSLLSVLINSQTDKNFKFTGFTNNTAHNMTKDKDSKKTDTTSINTINAMACRRIAISSINVQQKIPVAPKIYIEMP
jgi:hypothetical protein